MAFITLTPRCFIVQMTRYTVAVAYTDIGYTDKMSEDRTFSTNEAPAGYTDNSDIPTILPSPDDVGMSGGNCNTVRLDYLRIISLTSSLINLTRSKASAAHINTGGMPVALN